MDLYEKIMALCMDGYDCSQVVAMLVMESLGMENPELIRALHGLGGGVALSGNVCGCMSGGACALSLLSGKGPEAEQLEDYREIVKEFAAWFTEEQGTANCREILGGDWNKRFELCPEIIANSYMKCMEMIEERELAE